MGIGSPGDVSARRLGLVLAITAGFLVVELIGGLLSNSLALLSDAGHMFSDVTALGLAFLAILHMRRPPDRRRSFGYRRLEILSALANGSLLLIVAVAIWIQAIRRMREIPEIRSDLMLGVAIAGLVVNLAAIALLRTEGRKSLGVRGALFHVMGDTLGSAGTIVAAIVIGRSGWTPIDSLVSLGIGLLILAGGAHLVRESLHVLLEGVPRPIDLPELERTLRGVPGVVDLHDLHVWRIGSGFDTLTVHLILEDPSCWREARDQVRTILREEFRIGHTTIEIEGPTEPGGPECAAVICERTDG